MIDAVKDLRRPRLHDGGDRRGGARAREASSASTEELKKKLEDCTKGDILNAAFEKFAEKNLIQPTFIMDYPTDISPLTKQKPGDPTMTERFEAFVYGRELGNAYSELNDPIVQLERFRAAGAREGARRRRGLRPRRGLRVEPRGRHAPDGRHGHRHRPPRDVPHGRLLDPRRHPLPDDEAGFTVGGARPANVSPRTASI